MSDLVMVRATVTSAGEALVAAGQAFPPGWCPALGDSGCAQVDEAAAALWTSVSRVLMGAPAELVAVGRSALGAVDSMAAVDARLAGGGA